MAQAVIGGLTSASLEPMKLGRCILLGPQCNAAFADIVVKGEFKDKIILFEKNVVAQEKELQQRRRLSIMGAPS